MANYYGTGRTNYFHVTDEKRFEQLTTGLSAEWVDIQPHDKDKTLHVILCDNGLSWYPPPSMSDIVEEHSEFYDENGKKIDKTEIDNYKELFDKDGDCIYDRFDQDEDFDKFIEEIVKILPEDECFVYMESGHEKHRYIVGYAIVASHKGTKYMDLDKFIRESVAEMLGPEASTQTSN